MAAPSLSRSSKTPLVWAALLTVYVVWGSTYFGIRIAIDSLPPLGMLGIRFLIAGLLLYGVLRLRGVPAPTQPEWRASAVVGSLLLTAATGMVALAERDVSSSVTALVLAVIPLFGALFARWWGERTSRREWWGIGLGLLGILLLNLGDLRTTPLGAGLLILAALCWSLGSLWGKHLPLPPGLMGSAAEMLVGGLLLTLLSLVTRESWHAPTAASLWALAYLVVFGSLLAYSAYVYLLAHVRPALAMSYAYVNPVVAVVLGVGFGGELLSGLGWAALVVILAGVVLVAWPGQRQATT